MKEKKEDSLNKQVRQNYLKHFFEKTSLFSVLVLFALLCLVGAYFVPITLFISVPLLIFPLIIGFIFENLLTNGGEGSIKGLFQGFRLYYRPQFFGVFRGVEAFLKALGIYLATSITLLLILHFSLGLSDPNYVNILTKISNMENIRDLERNLQELQVNSTFLLITNISLITAFGIASYIVIHHVFTHLYKSFFNLIFNKHLPMKEVDFIHRRVFPKIRKQFYTDYYTSFWFITTLFVLSYVGGSFLAIFVFHQNGIQAGVIGLAFSVVVTSLLIPYLFDIYFYMMNVFGIFYLEGFINYENELKAVGFKGINFSEAEKANVKETVAELYKIMESKGKDKNKESEPKKEEKPNEEK